jgi:hypothetical protein
MLNTRKLMLGLAVAAGAAGSATAQITPIGPFSGSAHEDFTVIGQWPPQGPCIFCPSIPGAFGGICTLESVDGSASIHVTGGWGFQCSIGPHATPRISAATGGGGYDYHFDAASGAGKFGGYFGTNCGTPDGTIQFFDANNVMIGQDHLNVPADCSWTWQGWQFSTPVFRVRVIGNFSGGGYIQMDDMEFDRSSGPAPCYANCDGSTTAPILNVNDFTCFLNKFAAGDSYANCDGSTTPPVLNVNDFTCFLNKYAAGCP